MTEKKTIRVQEYAIGKYSSFSLQEMIIDLTEKANRVEEKYRDSVRFEIDEVWEQYDTSPTVALYISYDRLETDKEFETRIADEAKAVEAKLIRDRAEFERLRKQFGN